MPMSFELNDLEANSYPTLTTQTTLLRSLKQNNTDLFVRTIDNDSSGVNHFYLDDSENGTLLDIACRTPGNSFFVDNLLQRGVNLNEINRITGKAPLHEAVQNSDIVTLRHLLQHPDCNINIVDSNGYTALAYASIYNKVDFIDILVEYGACKSKTENLLLQEAQSSSTSNIPALVNRQKRNPAINAVRKLRTLSSIENDNEMYIKGDSVGEFIKKQYPIHAKEMQKSSALYTPIMKAVRYGYYETFEKLLKQNNVSIEPVAGKTILHIVLDGIVAEKYKECPARVFMENLVAGKKKRDSVNDAYFPPEPFSLFPDEKQDHYRCLEYILENIPSSKLDINFSDESGNTAFHYAVAWKETKAIQALLQAGAYTCKANKCGIIPLRSITPSMLEEYLDSCISSNDYPPEHSDYQITFNYKMFLSPLKQSSSITNKDGPSSESPKVQYQHVRESEPILIMNEVPRLRKLLVHPLIRSYLNLKWRIIKKYFYYNFILYFIYWFLMSTYLYYIFSFPNLPYSSPSETIIPSNSKSSGQQHHDSNNLTINLTQIALDEKVKISNENHSIQIQPLFFAGPEIIDNFTSPDGNATQPIDDICRATFDIPWRIVILITCSILLLREAFQAYVLPKSYLKSAENWLELSLFILTFILLTLYIHSPLRSSLSAVVILASWMELILLMGRHPFFSTHVEMFKTVSLNFLRFLLFYSILIIAFAFSFYILFKDKTDDDDNPTIFRHFSVSIFKTLIMLTGEYDASTIPFGDTFSIAHVFFVLFLFFIAIVLLNLLSGLAVGDTQQIRDDAEIVGIASRIRFIAYVETMAVGDPLQCLDFVDKLLLCFCCCFIRFRQKKKRNVSLEKVDDSTVIAYSNRKTLETFYKRISLSFRLRNSKIETFPNRSHFTWKSFDQQIIEDAVNILRRTKQADEMNDHCECNRQIQEYKEKLDKVENLLYHKQITELSLACALTKNFKRPGRPNARKKKRRFVSGNLKILPRSTFE